MKTNQHAQLQSQSSAVAERLNVSARLATPAVLATVQRVLGSQAQRLSAEVEAAPKNTVDGSVSYAFRASTTQGELNWKMDVALRDGVPVLSEARVLEEFGKALALKSAAAANLGETDAATMTVDFKKVQASRAGDLVVYSSPELPRWNMPVSTSELKTDEGRAQVLAELKKSIGFYCLSDFGMQATLVGDAGLPVVAAQDVRAAAQPKAMPQPDGWEDLVQGPEALLGARVQKPAQSFSPIELRAEGYRYGFEAKVRRAAEPVFQAWAKAQGGGAVEVIGWNFAEAKDSGTGVAQGKLVATLRYYTNTSREEVEVQAAFTAAGVLDAASVAKTEQQLSFEASRTAEFKVKSEAEAQAELERVAAERENLATIEAFIQANLGIAASGENVANGQNFLNTPVVKRIPILKALLPKEASEPGKKIELNGYVYELRPTEYNSIANVDHSAYLMACLTEEFPGKYPTLGLFGELGTLLTAGLIR